MSDDAYTANTPSSSPSRLPAHCPRCQMPMDALAAKCPHCQYDFPDQSPAPPLAKQVWYWSKPAGVVLVAAQIAACMGAATCTIGTIVIFRGEIEQALACLYGAVLFWGLTIVFARAADR